MREATITNVILAMAGDPPVTCRDYERLRDALEQAGYAPHKTALISVGEAAKRLGRSKSTIRTYIRKEILGTVVLPGFKQASGIRRLDVERVYDYCTHRRTA